MKIKTTIRGKIYIIKVRRVRFSITKTTYDTSYMIESVTSVKMRLKHEEHVLSVITEIIMKK
jgi:hypothetical protein